MEYDIFDLGEELDEEYAKSLKSISNEEFKNSFTSEDYELLSNMSKAIDIESAKALIRARNYIVL